MYFTQDDYLKIQKWLSRNSVRDTEFQEADTPLKGNETVVLVQNGHNRKILISDLVDQIFTLGTTDFLNVSEFSKEYGITLEEAITLVPPKSRKEGQVISFKNEEGNWEIYQFTGTINQWTSIDLWKSFLSENSGGGSGEIANGSIYERHLSDDLKNTINKKIADSINALNTIEVPYKNSVPIITDVIQLLPDKGYYQHVPTVNEVYTDSDNRQPPPKPSRFENLDGNSPSPQVFDFDYSTKGQVFVVQNESGKDYFAYIFLESKFGTELANTDVYTYYPGLELIENKYYDKPIYIFENYTYDGIYKNDRDGKYYKFNENQKIVECSEEDIPPETLSIQEAINDIYSKLNLL